MSKPMRASGTIVAFSEETACERMTLIRAVEEKLLSLFSEGKLFGTTHTCIGQEMSAAAVVSAIDRDRDVVFSSHRCHGHFLVYADDAEALLAEIMGRQTGVCGGRGGSQHLCRRNFYSNGIQGGIVPVSTGMALAEKIKASGAIAVCFLGDGTLGEGTLYEAFNMASLWRAPILFVLEHNQYAQSTPTALTTAGDVTARAAAFDIPSDRRPADDPIGLHAHLSAVIERVRGGAGPFLQVLDTYRLAAHSKGDDDRDPAEIERHRQCDPLRRLQTTLGASAVSCESAATARIEAAVAAAEAAPFAVVDHESEARRFASRVAAVDPLPALAHTTAAPERLVVQHLNAALHGLMESDAGVLLIGEDLLDPYGGAFKVSRGLSTRFPDRIMAAPISEASIVGVATGMSMRGLRPVVEIMFGDFLTLTADQIVNHAAKFNWMYNGQADTPLVIRTPVGGRRGYGPTHSQCLEKMFLGVPGLVVVAVSLRHAVGELLRRAVAEDPRPVLFLEQKMLYAKRLAVQPPAGLTFEVPASEREALYPTGLWRSPEHTADVTVVTYGAMTEMVETAIARAFDEEEILCEYLVVSQLAPLRIDPILESVGRTGRLVVAEEGTTPWGFGAEVVAQVAQACGRPPRVARVGAHHLPVPNARPAEEEVLPDAGRIYEAITGLMR